MTDERGPWGQAQADGLAALQRHDDIVRPHATRRHRAFVASAVLYCLGLALVGIQATSLTYLVSGAIIGQAAFALYVDRRETERVRVLKAIISGDSQRGAPSVDRLAVSNRRLSAVRVAAILAYATIILYRANAT